MPDAETANAATIEELRAQLAQPAYERHRDALPAHASEHRQEYEQRILRSVAALLRRAQFTVAWRLWTAHAAQAARHEQQRGAVSAAREQAVAGHEQHVAALQTEHAAALQAIQQ